MGENWISNLFHNVVFQTIISGTLIFILSQYILKFILDPIDNYRKVVTKVDNKLKFYSNVIVNPPFSEQLSEDYLSAKKDLRILSSELEASYKAIPFKSLFSLIQLVGKREEISEAVKDLIWLSNITGHKDRSIEIGGEKTSLISMASKKINDIRDYLKIKEL